MLLSRVAGYGDVFTTREAADVAPGEASPPVALAPASRKKGEHGSPKRSPSLRARASAARKVEKRPAKLARPGKKVRLPSRPPRAAAESPFDPARSFTAHASSDVEIVEAPPRRRRSPAMVVSAIAAAAVAVGLVASSTGGRDGRVEVYHSGIVSTQGVVVIGEVVASARPEGDLLRLIVRASDGGLSHTRVVDLPPSSFGAREEDGRFGARFRVEFPGLGSSGYEIAYGWVDRSRR